MSNTDQELFELCKQVYEKTGWDDTKEAYYRKGHYNSDGKDYEPGEPFIVGNTGKYVDFPYEFMSPLYTSDYLLEKLPVYNSDAEGMLSLTTRQGAERNGWMAYYQDIDGYSVGEEGIGKSPLKALLKLTLALHEAGLLTNTEENI